MLIWHHLIKMRDLSNIVGDTFNIPRHELNPKYYGSMVMAALEQAGYVLREKYDKNMQAWKVRQLRGFVEHRRQKIGFRKAIASNRTPA